MTRAAWLEAVLILAGSLLVNAYLAHRDHAAWCAEQTTAQQECEQ